MPMTRSVVSLRISASTPMPRRNSTRTPLTLNVLRMRCDDS
ncbi:unnamed protein product [Toxocara canis]|uniref:Uncharacterized protein n=1 Tax=Toxocara canis TaxID=6265 RepID=A0A3P7F0Z3_TOXCA|nr:unnamed protein product [Toxocara canis]